jgi:hypothetical protein
VQCTAFEFVAAQTVQHGASRLGTSLGNASIGGGPGGRAQQAEVPGASHCLSRPPELTNAEVVQLQIRVIALESLMISLLAEGSARQLKAARKMAEHISPRPGFTLHRQTVHAAAGIASLLDRAARVRSKPTRARLKP